MGKGMRGGLEGQDGGVERDRGLGGQREGRTEGQMKGGELCPSVHPSLCPCLQSRPGAVLSLANYIALIQSGSNNLQAEVAPNYLILYLGLMSVNGKETLLGSLSYPRCYFARGPGAADRWGARHPRQVLKGTELALPWGLYPHPVGSDSPYTAHSPAPPASYWDLALVEE